MTFFLAVASLGDQSWRWLVFGGAFRAQKGCPHFPCLTYKERVFLSYRNTSSVVHSAILVAAALLCPEELVRPTL